MKTLTSGLLMLMVLMGAAVTTGCNTVEGAGKDIERAGEGVQKANCTEADKKAGKCS